MLKKNRKKKHKRKFCWRHETREFQHYSIAMVAFLVVGAWLLIFGIKWNIFRESEISTTVFEVVSVERVSRNLSAEQQDQLREQGLEVSAPKVSYIITYRYMIDGEEHLLEKEVTREELGSVSAGDKEEHRYVLRGGEVVIDPKTNLIYTIGGSIFIIIAIISGVIAFKSKASAF